MSLRFLMVLLLFPLLMAGCASTGKRTGELLAVNHQNLSDTDLQSYYRQLNDQIALEERGRRGGTWVGVGVGSSPVSVGVSQQVGGGPVVAEELRERRNAVRSELDRRGLLP